MSKKLAPLKALASLRCAVSLGLGTQYEEMNNKCDIIETALKDYELLKERTKLDSFECLMRLEEILPRGKELLIPVAKQLKALEIIKKKILDMDYLKVIAANCNLTYQEYELLRKVLGNENTNNKNKRNIRSGEKSI